jgi:hypothetical protein
MLFTIVMKIKNINKVKVMERSPKIETPKVKTNQCKSLKVVLIIAIKESVIQFTAHTITILFGVI